jgi:2',3'-cyclic-nucleotide 2'-phosphodiesterase (5'-nucleotidase family)
VFRDSFTPGSVAGWVGAQFPYLSANLEFSADADLNPRFTNTATTAGLEEAASQKGRIVPSAVVTKNGEKIGLVGATTQVLELISSTGGVEVKGFNGDGSERDDMALLASQLQPVIDDLISQGVNKVILMAHLQQIANEKALAPLLRGVDIILAGGSNTRLGDSNDQAVAFPGHAANFAEAYPLLTQGADAAPTLIVNTDNEYTYLGRLVVDFDAQGRIIPGSVDPLVSGAYAATAANVAKAWNVPENQLAATAFAEGTKAENVQDLTDAVQAVIASKDGQVWGFTKVYLEGERAFVRSEETNLGDLTADANLVYARTIDPKVVISLKNGGGIRSQIGSVDVVSGAKNPPLANPSASKPEGGVSTLDIENSLRFNNSLSLVTVSASKLKELLEHGIALYPNQGRFPQVSGLAFSFDLTKPAGSRILNLAIQDSQGNDLDVVVRGGALAGDPTRTFRMVTLNFLAGGGDSYPFPTDATANRVDLFNAAAPLTGAASFSGDGTEQDALAEYLKSNHGTADKAYNQADTSASRDLRLQNIGQRSDTVIDLGTVTINGLTLITDRPSGYQIRRGTSAPIQITFAGQNASQANPGSGWSAIGAFASGSGYQLFWRHALNNQYSRWFLSASGALLQGALITSTEFFGAEANLNFDLNFDGTIGLPYVAGPMTIGSINLGTVNLGAASPSYSLRNGAAAPLLITFSGQNVSASNAGANWVAVAAATSGTGYQVYWRNNVTLQYSRWILNASGALATWSILAPADVYAAESGINYDLNGDGLTGLVHTPGANTIGAVNLGSTALGYAIKSGANAPVSITYAGQNITASNAGANWVAVAAATSGTGYQVYWRNNVTLQYSRWILNASGDLATWSILAPADVYAAESGINYDLNGDGVSGLAYTPGAITIGAVNLGSTALGYAVKSGANAPVSITYAGQNITASNAGANWVAVAAATSGTGYQVYWRNSVTLQYSRWILNASGALATSSILSPADLYASESSINHDLNRDGITGLPFTPAGATIGGLSLGTTPFGYALQPAGGAVIPVTYSGVNASPSNPGGNWTAVAAASAGSGFDLYWRNTITSQFSRWSLNSSGLLGSFSLLNPAQLITAETTIGFDLNGNGIIGAALI